MLKSKLKEYLLITIVMWFIYLPPLTIWALFFLNYTIQQYDTFLIESVPFDLLTNYPIGKFIIYLTTTAKKNGWL